MEDEEALRLDELLELVLEELPEEMLRLDEEELPLLTRDVVEVLPEEDVVRILVSVDPELLTRLLTVVEPDDVRDELLVAVLPELVLDVVPVAPEVVRVLLVLLPETVLELVPDVAEVEAAPVVPEVLRLDVAVVPDAVLELEEYPLAAREEEFVTVTASRYSLMSRALLTRPEALTDGRLAVRVVKERSGCSAP